MGSELVIVIALIILTLPVIGYLFVGLLWQYAIANANPNTQSILPCFGFCLGAYASLESGFALRQLNAYLIWVNAHTGMTTILLGTQVISAMISVLVLSVCSVMLINLVFEVGLNWLLRALGRAQSVIDTSTFRPLIITLVVSLGFNFFSEFILENSEVSRLLTF